MKTKFKPTNLGRRPRGSNASTPKELAPCQQQDDMAGGDLPSEGTVQVNDLFLELVVDVVLRQVLVLIITKMFFSLQTRQLDEF